MRVTCLPAPRTQTIGPTAKASQFRQVGFTQDHGSLLAQALDDKGVLGRRPTHQPKGAGTGLLGIPRLDSVLEQHGNAMQRPTDLATGALQIKRAGNLQRLGLSSMIELNFGSSLRMRACR